MRPWAAPDYCCLVRRSVISHVIPLRLVQILNWHRWNCNVCGLSRKMTELNYVRNLFRGSRWRVSAPQALRTVGCVPIGGRAPIGVFFRLKYRSGSPTTSHAIPLWLVQTLNLHRWNCNVFGLSRKMTELNYVRNLSGGFLADACRRVLARVSVCLRVSAPQLAAWTSGPSGAACASLWLDGRCMLPDLSPFYGTASASDNPGPLVPQWGYVPALDTVTAWSQFRTT